MARTSTLTTGEIAAHCEVTAVTVWNWIRRGSLPAAATPGGHHRVRLADFEAFLAAHGMPPYRAARRRILVVDDNADVVVPIRRMLARSGYAVEVAEDGFGAGIKVGTFGPDLVVLDLYMPQLDGFAVCRGLRASPSTRATRILAITGQPDPETQRQALAAGADEVLTKPFRLAALAAVVARLLRDEGAAATAG